MKEPENKGIVGRVKTLIEPILASMGLELVDVEQRGGTNRALIRIFIDKTGGVNLKDCQEASIYLGHALDVEDPIPCPYTLEVSSPGLDRPFKQTRDYERALGKLIQVKLVHPREGQWVFVGRLNALEDVSITVELEDGQSMSFALEEIRQARLEIEW